MFHFFRQRMVWAFLFAAIPGSLYAADGVVVIDQDRAMAGNVTEGDAPGFPVTISQPGSYRLAGNLTVPDANTTAIRITASFVTLDLKGFGIVGPVGCTTPPTTCWASGTGIGVQAGADQKTGPRGVRILNGSVRGMGLFGISLKGDGSYVENITADSNAGGGMTVSGSVIKSAATQNGDFGIIGITVRDSTALQNRNDGILLDAGGVASGNVASVNGGVGLYVPFGTATGNTVFLNKSFGVLTNCPSSITGNTIVSNEGGSIEAKGTGCVLTGNATRP